MPRKKQDHVAAEPAAVAPEKPAKAQDCYYVWNEQSEFVQAFHEQDYKGEAKKHARALADQHEGWTVT